MVVNDIKEPLTSIIIPTKDNIEMLKRCVDSIENKSQYKNYEIIIVDNSNKASPYLSSLKHKIIAYNEPFNFSRLNNVAVTNARGQYIIFLNDDTLVISSDWIERMLEHSQKPEVGAVGAKLLYPNDRIQHAGVLIGVGGMTSLAFEGFPRDHPGHHGVQSIRNCSAVTAACMMTRKKLFQEAGGFDERLAYSFNDVDFCLRLRKKGYSIIYTPHSELYHYTTYTRPYTVPVEEIKYFIERWHDLIIEGDPYYDRGLSRLKPYIPKTKEERFVLTDLGLFEESELGTLPMLNRYVRAANKISKQHGFRRLTIEFLRFLRIRFLSRK
ncbi:MAG: glycosyltransferase family 2 protein [Nitrososphaerales archaeon]